MRQKIVLIGGPGSGKTSVLNALQELGFYCMPEISREITLNAQKKGITQLFLHKPLLFSEMLLEGRENQFLEAQKLNHKFIFFDRGLPDIFGYLEYSKTDYPSIFITKSKKYIYNVVFVFKPWQAIYTSDNERYETFEEAKKIHIFLENAYKKIGYTPVTVPFGTIKDRANFIVNYLKTS